MKTSLPQFKKAKKEKNIVDLSDTRSKLRYLLKYRDERVLYLPNIFAEAIYHIADRLIEIFMASLEIYVSKDRANGASLINLWPGSRGLLIELQILHQTIILQ